MLEILVLSRFLVVSVLELLRRKIGNGILHAGEDAMKEI